LPASALGRGRARVDDPPMQHAPARLVLALAVAVAVVAGAAAPAHAKPDAKQAKINVYVDVLNQWSSYVYKQRDDYAAWVDLAKGPDCKSTKARGPSAIGDTAKTSTFPGYLKALKKGPKLPVDAAAVTMVTTLQALWQPSFDASEYYYKRQWKDDDCKRGRELHTQLVELWAQYVAAEAQVRAFVVQYNDDRELAQHAATAKKYGKKLRFQFEQVLIDGKQLVRTLDVALAATPIDAAAITAKLDAFAASVDATNQLAEANRGKAKIYDVLYQGGYTQFVTRAGWFKDAVVELGKTIADPKAKPADIGHDHDEAVKAYNAMIDGANAVRLTPSIK
jgi:hypothetical protein